MLQGMEMEIHAQAELIRIQKKQIGSLEKQIRILEEQKKKLMTAGNTLSEQCEKLDQICTSQQETLEEFQKIFSEILKKQPPDTKQDMSSKYKGVFS